MSRPPTGSARAGKFIAPQEICSGQLVHGRFRTLEEIGGGSSSTVWLCWDSMSKQLVAIKFFEVWKGMRQQSERETRVLSLLLHDTDAEDVCDASTVPVACDQCVVGHKALAHHGLIQLIGTFELGARDCIVFPYIKGQTLKTLIGKQYRCKGLPHSSIVDITRQILLALKFLAHEDRRIGHGDLKPDNIMLHQGKEDQLVLIDFGLAYQESEVKSGAYIQSRWYRCPEVLLCIKPTVASDMWSLGCIVAELLTGVPPFQGTDSFDQLYLLCTATGRVPDALMVGANPQTINVVGNMHDRLDKEWDKWYNNKLCDYADRPCAKIFKMVTLRSRKQHESVTASLLSQWLDLLSKMFHQDPALRITAEQALDHPIMQQHAQPGNSLQLGHEDQPVVDDVMDMSAQLKETTNNISGLKRMSGEQSGARQGARSNAIQLNSDVYIEAELEGLSHAITPATSELEGPAW